MSKTLVTLLSVGWLGIAFGQAPAAKPNEVQQATQGAMQQRDYAGDNAKVDKAAPKPKTTNKQKASEVDAATAGAMQQRDYAGEQAKVSKTTKPATTSKQKAAEVDAATAQTAQQRDYAGEQAKAAKPAPKQ